MVAWNGSTGFYDVNPQDIGLKVNGVALADPSANLLPGIYDLTVSNPKLTLNQPTLVVTDFEDPQDYAGKVVLKPAVQAELRQATKARLAQCLAMRKLSNPSCGINYQDKTYDGSTLEPGSLRCSQRSGRSALDRLNFTVDGYAPTVAKADLKAAIACSVSATNGRGYEGDVSLYRVEVDLASKPLEVTFS